MLDLVSRALEKFGRLLGGGAQTYWASITVKEKRKQKKLPIHSPGKGLELRPVVSSVLHFFNQCIYEMKDGGWDSRTAVFVYET